MKRLAAHSGYLGLMLTVVFQLCVRFKHFMHIWRINKAGSKVGIDHPVPGKSLFALIFSIHGFLQKWRETVSCRDKNHNKAAVCRLFL